MEFFHNGHFIEKPDVSKIQEYIDYCEEKMSDVNKQLREFRKDKEIQKLENELEDVKNHCLQIFSDKELEKIKAFKNKHYKECKNNGTYWFKLTGTGIGTDIVIKCDKCGEEENVTDTQSW